VFAAARSLCAAISLNFASGEIVVMHNAEVLCLIKAELSEKGSLA
jgi:hypothetical protein